VTCKDESSPSSIEQDGPDIEAVLSLGVTYDAALLSGTVQLRASAQSVLSAKPVQTDIDPDEDQGQSMDASQGVNTIVTTDVLKEQQSAGVELCTVRELLENPAVTPDSNGLHTYSSVRPH